VYSIGSGRDFRFEKAVHKHLPHCSIHTIDMQYTICPNNICIFHFVTLGDGQNGTKTLRQLMIDINHTNAEIDILKIDIEYSEYLFFHNLFSNNEINQKLRPIYIRQILIVRSHFELIDEFIYLFRKFISFANEYSKPMLYFIYLIHKITLYIIEKSIQVFLIMLPNTVLLN
jgi:hypothetical protein